jgi:hypothetical protein
MGTHPTNPSKIYGSNQLLSEYLADKEDLLGAAQGFEPPFDGREAEGGHVPFLFKILCANQGECSDIWSQRRLTSISTSSSGPSQQRAVGEAAQREPRAVSGQEPQAGNRSLPI